MPPDDLLRALTALGTAQGRWLADVEATVREDASFAPAFRRWAEHLTMIKLQYHRTENRLLNYCLVPRDPASWRGPTPAALDGRAAARDWRVRFEHWFDHIHLSTAYRRLEDVLDLDAEAVNADVVTDLTALAEVAVVTTPILSAITAERDPVALEDLAFYRVLSPWRRQGLPALHLVLPWLDQVVDEMDTW